jgi:hypothetical protein
MPNCFYYRNFKSESGAKKILKNCFLDCQQSCFDSCEIEWENGLFGFGNLLSIFQIYIIVVLYLLYAVIAIV